MPATVLLWRLKRASLQRVRWRGEREKTISNLARAIALPAVILAAILDDTLDSRMTFCSVLVMFRSRTGGAGTWVGRCCAVAQGGCFCRPAPFITTGEGSRRGSSRRPYDGVGAPVLFPPTVLGGMKATQSNAEGGRWDFRLRKSLCLPPRSPIGLLIGWENPFTNCSVGQ